MKRSSKQLSIKTPIAIIIYKRPNQTKKLLAVLKEAPISNLYVIAEGPKNKTEEKICQQTRKLIDEIDWQCTIHKNYSSKNLGLRKRIVSGLNWVFKHTNQAIILEDDCIPNQDFFRFCEEMLDKYATHPRVMSVSGTSCGISSSDSYAFAKYPLCWGWATWKRAWRLFDLELLKWGGIKKPTWLAEKFPNPILRWYWKNIITLMTTGSINSWAYAWTFAHMVNDAVTIIPGSNLIENTGFDKDATHTKHAPSLTFPVSQLTWPLAIPKSIIQDNTANKNIEKTFYLTPLAFLGLLRLNLMKLFK